MTPAHLITAPVAAVAGFLLAAPAALAANGEDTPLNLEGAARDAAPAAGSGGSVVRTVVGLAIVVGVIFGLHWVLKQVKASREASSSGPGLERLATLSLAPGRAVHLVRAGGEIVLVGSAEHGVVALRSWSEPEARALGLLEEPAAEQQRLQPQASPRPKPQLAPRPATPALPAALQPAALVESVRRWTVRG